MKLLRRLVGWLRPKMPVVNILLALAAWWANDYLDQGFCQPVPWVWWVLVPSVGAFLVWPWLKWVRWLNYLLLFLQGAFLLVCLYCTLFVSGYLLVALVVGFLLYPLLMWTPVVFGVQLLRRVWANPLPGARKVFAAGMVPLLLAQGWAWRQYQQIEDALATLPANWRKRPEHLLLVVPRTYMTERLAGQLFKYHAVALMIVDGWRPPLHDPLVNICLWAHAANGYTGPLTINSDINTQAAFYHQLFPSEPIKVDCGCNVGGDGYYDWKPGLTDGVGTLLVEVERRQREFDAEMARMQAQALADSAYTANHSKPPPQ